MTEPRRSPLEPTADEMRRMVELATERIVEHIVALPRQPAQELDGAEELGRSLIEEMPEAGAPLGELLDLLFERAVPKSFNNAGPGFLAYIPGGGLFESAVADLIADSVNRYVTVWTAAPGLVQLEVNVVRWFCRMVGYPPSAMGFLTSGGSLANFSALFTARRERLQDSTRDAVLYVSSQVHHSVARAATLAGFPAESLVKVPVDDRWRLRPETLEEAIAADRAAGRRPFMVVASAGTTNTGAVDDLTGLADLAEREGLWLHVDAAYGGFFALTERGRRRLHGLERADSLVLDPHKGLFLPYGTGCLLVRDGGALGRAHRIHADYMPPMQESDELVDFCNISPELSRDFRGLRVWLPLKLHGAGAFRQALDEKLDLAQWAASELKCIEGVELVDEPQLSVVPFRLEIPELDGERLDRMNRDLLDAVNRRRRVFLTGTVLEGRFVLRICVLSFRTHLDRMRMCLEDIRSAVDEVRARWLDPGSSPTGRAGREEPARP